MNQEYLKNVTKSNFEKTVKKNLQDRDAKFFYEPMGIPYVIEGRYKPDFVISKNGKKPKTLEELEDCIIIETKGYFRLNDMRKMLGVKKKNPTLDIRFVFMSDSFVYRRRPHVKRRSKGSTDMRYSDWCTKHGFKYAFGEVPKEWLDEVIS